MQRRASQGLSHVLSKIGIFAPRRRIAFYYANDGEIDPEAAMNLARRFAVRCFLPVIPRPAWRTLRFAEVINGNALVSNRFGIMEPAVHARSLRRAIELDVVLVPLVAFDSRGNRIGMGSGFYDSTLAIRAAGKHFRKPAVIGLAHECQRLDHLSVDPWDIPLDFVATDKHLYRFESSQTDSQD
ncbi:MAG: 5-formyltetrahydrofolate cyclo-ligase [marine bacterium B5-7]|nr:MAG: 5-formyltetrahydrofolate cyclo-ligase [marine bacterium B5-7]